MGSVGKQQLVRRYEVLDASCGAVEARSEPCHLVFAFYLDAGGKVASTKRFHPGLQPFEPAGQPAHERIGANRNGERDAAEEANEAEHGPVLPVRRPRDNPAVVGKANGPCRALAPMEPTAGFTTPARRRDGSARSRDWAPLAVEQPQIDAQPLIKTIDRLLLRGRIGADGG